MTDFFADLEREIRAAHPRRPRPAVPVRGIAATAAVATALVALVFALGALTGATEGEVAQRPPIEEGWTAYAPLDCGSEVVDEPVPAGAIKRFAILTVRPEADILAEAEIPAGIGIVVRHGVRRVAAPGGRTYAFVVALPVGENCEPRAMAPCLISLESGRFTCAMKGSAKPLMSHLVDDLPGGRRVVAVLAEDGVRRVEVRVGSELIRVDVEDNVAFAQLTGPGGVEVAAAGP